MALLRIILFGLVGWLVGWVAGYVAPAHLTSIAPLGPLLGLSLFFPCSTRDRCFDPELETNNGQQCGRMRFFLLRGGDYNAYERIAAHWIPSSCSNDHFTVPSGPLCHRLGCLTAPEDHTRWLGLASGTRRSDLPSAGRPCIVLVKRYPCVSNYVHPCTVVSIRLSYRKPQPRSQFRSASYRLIVINAATTLLAPKPCSQPIRVAVAIRLVAQGNSDLAVAQLDIRGSETLYHQARAGLHSVY